MNPMEFVLGIIIIGTIGSILKARFGHPGGRRRSRSLVDRDDGDGFTTDTAEAVRLREEVRMLKERINTLERITVDRENSLSREIDDLRKS